MSLVNFTTREITCKIVYYGPGRSGKTTNRAPAECASRSIVISRLTTALRVSARWIGPSCATAAFTFLVTTVSPSDTGYFAAFDLPRRAPERPTDHSLPSFSRRSK